MTCVLLCLEGSRFCRGLPITSLFVSIAIDAVINAPEFNPASIDDGYERQAAMMRFRDENFLQLVRSQGQFADAGAGFVIIRKILFFGRVDLRKTATLDCEGGGRWQTMHPDGRHYQCLLPIPEQIVKPAALINGRSGRPVLSIEATSTEPTMRLPKLSCDVIIPMT